MRIWIVNVFADRAFSGASAAVAPLDAWIDETLMRAIAAETGASETAFFAPTGLKGNYELKAFSPRGEAIISGHSALAAGAVLLSEIEPTLELAVFDAATGPLVTRRAKGGFAIDLPRRNRTPWTAPTALIEAVAPHADIEDAFAGEYATLVLETAHAVRGLAPDLEAIAKLVPGPRAGCLTVSAAAEEGADHDFVCRFFAPGAGVAEDAVTAAAFADLTAYWCDRLDRGQVSGRQLSARGGFVRGWRTLSSSRLEGASAIFLRGALDASVMGAGASPQAQGLVDAAEGKPSEDDLVVHIREEAPSGPALVTVFEATPALSMAG